MIKPIIFCFLVVFGSLFFGYFIQRKRYLRNPEEVSSLIVRNTFRFVSPIILCLSFWRLDIKNASVWTLPLVGMSISTVVLFLAMHLVSLHKLTPKESGSYITSAMFSNVGYTLGGFLCFVLFGEIGLALAIMYTLYYTPYFYTVGFYVARHYGLEKKAGVKKTLKQRFTPLEVFSSREKRKELLTGFIEDIRFFPFIGFIAGVILNLANVPRAPVFTDINRVLVPVATVGYFSSIGLTFRFSTVKKYKAVCLSMSAIKFAVSPAIGLCLAYLMGYHKVMGGLPMKVVIIESAMPVAFAALLLTVLFDIDRDLTNACWLVTTLMMVIVIPILASLISVF